MVNDRFIQLLTKELCNELTDVEREELRLFLQNKEYYDQHRLLKEYWERDKGEYETNTTMFKKVIEKIKAEESAPTPTAGQTLTPITATTTTPIAGSTVGQAANQTSNPNTSPIATQTINQPVEPFPADPILPRKSTRTIWYSAAAAVLLTFGAATWYYHSQKEHHTITPVALHWLERSTHAAQKDSLTLSDGTVVTLNAATTIKYPDHFDGNTREVTLEGEAFFDVSKDAKHPFIIHAGKMNIRVLGTSFNVKSYQSEAQGETTLITGSIEVTLDDRPSDRIILKPKEKLIIQNNLTIKKMIGADTIAQDNPVKSTRYSLTNLTYFRGNTSTVVETSWVDNKLVFSGKDFIDLSGQLERWYGVHIEFQNEHVKHYNFTGFFEKESLSEALDALKMIEHFNYNIADSTVYIY